MHYLNIPGLYNSGPQHWQTRWEQNFTGSFSRVQQDNWELPVRTEWVSKLDQHIRKLDKPSILVAHSLGCITAVHWLRDNHSPLIKAAFLVAPADVDRSEKSCFKTFAPVPLSKITIPSIVVASTDDPYCEIHRAARWAAYWGSRFTCVGDCGHINSDSNLNGWETGFSLLNELDTAAIQSYRHAS